MALDQTQFDKLKTRLSTSKKLTAPTESQSGLGSNIKTAFSRRAEAGAEAINSDQSTASKVLQTVGQGAGFVGDLGFEALKSVTPEPVEEAVKSGVEKVANTQPAQAVISSITEWATKHPEAARNLQAVVDIGSIIPANKAIGVGADLIGSGAKKVAVGAVDDVARIGNKVSDVITPIEKGTEVALNPTKLIPKERLRNIKIDDIVAQAEQKSVKLENYVKVAEEAVQDYSKATPLAKAGEKASGALNVINNKLSKQAQLKNDALDVVGEKTVKNIATFRTKLRDELRERVGVNLSLTDEGIDIVPATGRSSKIAFDPADNKLIRDTYEVLSSLGNTPTVRQLDDTIDALQDLLYKRNSAVAVPVNGQVEGVIKSVTGQLNNAVKKVGGEQYRKANSKYAYFVDVRDKLNKALGSEGERGATLMKKLFSPSGEAPRRLFEDIKKLTGIDLVEEATLAKFVMENVGDARQASLLEEVISGRLSTPKSFVGVAAEKLINKLQDPVGKARRIIKESTKK